MSDKKTAAAAANAAPAAPSFITLKVEGITTSNAGNPVLLVSHPAAPGEPCHVTVRGGNTELALAASEVMVEPTVERLQRTRRDGTVLEDYVSCRLIGVAGNRASRLREEASAKAEAARTLAALGL